MTEKRSRRSFIAGSGAAIAGAGLFGAVTGVASAEYTRSLSISGGDTIPVHAGVEKFVERDPAGALWSDVYIDSRRQMVLKDLHTMVTDGQGVYNTRDDVSSAEINVTSPRVPECYIDSEIPVADGTVSLTQTGMICKRGSLLVRNEASLPAGSNYRFFTLANPIMGDLYDDPASGDEAWTTSRGYYDVIVATNGDYYVAFAQKEGWRKAFDSHRIGSQSDLTAWADLNDDGYLSPTEYNSGRIDLAYELSAGDRTSMEWLNALGFAYDADTAVDRAVASLDDGYETERNRYIPWL